MQNHAALKFRYLKVKATNPKSFLASVYGGIEPAEQKVLNMKFSTQEEYGLRCLIRISQSKSANGLTIPEISDMEKLSQANVGKLLRTLRLGGFIDATRGQNGGYKLARPADEITVGEVLAVLGGRLFESTFCKDHSGINHICTHTIDCSVRSLWKKVQDVVDSVLERITIKDLLASEAEVKTLVNTFIDESELITIKN